MAHFGSLSFLSVLPPPSLPYSLPLFLSPCIRRTALRPSLPFAPLFCVSHPSSFSPLPLLSSICSSLFAFSLFSLFSSCRCHLLRTLFSFPSHSSPFSPPSSPSPFALLLFHSSSSPLAAGPRLDSLLVTRPSYTHLHTVLNQQVDARVKLICEETLSSIDRICT